MCRVDTGHHHCCGHTSTRLPGKGTCQSRNSSSSSQLAIPGSVSWSTPSKATSKSGRVGPSAEREVMRTVEGGQGGGGACGSMHASISEALSSAWCQEEGTAGLQRAGLSSGLPAGASGPEHGFLCHSSQMHPATRRSALSFQSSHSHSSISHDFTLSHTRAQTPGLFASRSI